MRLSIFSAPKLFKFLEHEAQLTQCILTNGLQEIANADLSDYRKGKFYGGAFQLSIRLERLMKLIIILDHMLKNEYNPPSEHYLRKEIGHDLEKLYKRIKELPIEQRDDAFSEEPLEYETLKVLSDFAKGTRYYNLNQLSIDCIAEGIETESDLKKISQLGIHLHQGWYYARSMSAEKIVTYVVKSEVFTSM
jgi:hypothetical protein